jgi:IS6 family transposase
MGERGVQVNYSTLFRWVQVYGPEIERRLRRQPSHVSSSWRVDETSVYIQGEVHWLYRARAERRLKAVFRVLQQ